MHVLSCEAEDSGMGEFRGMNKGPVKCMHLIYKKR